MKQADADVTAVRAAKAETIAVKFPGATFVDTPFQVVEGTSHIEALQEAEALLHSVWSALRGRDFEGDPQLPVLTFALSAAGGMLTSIRRGLERAGATEEVAHG